MNSYNIKKAPRCVRNIYQRLNNRFVCNNKYTHEVAKYSNSLILDVTLSKKPRNQASKTDKPKLSYYWSNVAALNSLDCKQGRIDKRRKYIHTKKSKAKQSNRIKNHMQKSDIVTGSDSAKAYIKISNWQEYSNSHKTSWLSLIHI